MKLLRARIKNFRSIEDLSVEFRDGCQILLGINESGKSNILRALQLLDTTTATSIDDLRIAKSEHPEVTEGFVRFDFLLDETESELVYAQVSKLFDQTSLKHPLIKNQGRDLTFEEFCAVRNLGLYEISLPSGKRAFSFYGLPSNTYSITPGWVRNGAMASEFNQTDGLTVTVPPKTVVYADKNQIVDSEPVSAESINRMIGIEIIKIVEAKLPVCIFWKYADNYLLPSSVDIATFSQAPETCRPLQSMFELAGYASKDIGSTINAVRGQIRQQRYFNLLQRVSEAATKHIRKVWSDHKTIKFELKADGPSLSPLITDDEVSLDMASRSDGFKRFVSFLLLVSAKVRSEQMKGVLLLVDEPEIALHPGGARCLMNELVEIGQSNTVVYSTHSIFMVDPYKIERHLIVEKKNEITTAKIAEKSRIQDEEVLYAAMGYSIFETLKRKNVIFEGWRDKEIFRIALESSIKNEKDLKAIFQEIGMTFAEGVKDVKNVARFLELASRSCLIISDADSAALARRKDYQKLGAWGKWVTLRDILGADGPITGEDLILRPSLIKRSNKFRSTIANLGTLSDASFNASEPTLSGLKRWLETAGATGDILEEQLNWLKNALYVSLKREELSPKVDDLISYVRAYDFNQR